MNITDWLAITGTITGVAGSVMGVVATIDMLRKNRVRLRVVPKLGWHYPNGLVISTVNDPSRSPARLTQGKLPNRFVVEVVNLSAFPITVSEVGFGRRERKSRVSFVQPDVSPGYEWPAVVEPRRSVTIAQPIDRTSDDPKIMYPMFVKTECGATKFAWSNALAWYVRQQG